VVADLVAAASPLYGSPMFDPVDSSVSFPKLEEAIARLWRQRRIYEKSLDIRRGAPRFVFYEGPPTANGLPHPGHCLTRAIKDLFPRYKTMRGYLCERKAGWDTHGLPVEVEVCKELGIHSKEEIEAFGVEPFIRKCIESVFRYTLQWEQLTERLGFWIRLDDAYVTFHQSYVESVWWALKNLFDRGLLYQGHKIVWWWAQGGTALSSGEVGQGYREVADPSVYVRFPIVVDEKARKLGLDENTSLLIWTTTPWTLPGNQFAAVHPQLNYSLIVDPTDERRKLIVAESLAGSIAEKGKPRTSTATDWVTKCTFNGKDLVDLRYEPPFDYYYRNEQYWGGPMRAPSEEQLDALSRHRAGHGTAEDAAVAELLKRKTPRSELVREFEAGDECRWLRAWRVRAAEFVTTDTGTGIVHVAPAFGEDDFDLLHGVAPFLDFYLEPDLLCPVAPDGTFNAEAPDYQGRWVKDCDRDIIRDLKARGLLYHQEQYVHDYPFCWRAEEDPLIQYPRRSWFIRTTQFKEKMLANNSRINWLPEHIRDGRFGNFLETNVDWALSRERYWGTPLPIWVCEKTGYMEAVASYDELLAKPGVAGTEVWEKAKAESPGLPDDLRVHKPYIDAITYDSPQSSGARMRRVPEVIDCWFDSGAMPFAQWGYPGQPGSAERFRDQFPADFISEALDQTRGWFYSLLAISTLLFSEDSQAEVPSPKGRGDITIPPSLMGRGDKAPQPAPRGKGGTAPPAVPYPHPFRNCIVLGLMLGEDGGKMSKSKRNYREPNEIFNRYGADALRWYFFSDQPPWTTIRYSEEAIRECIPEFLLRLWNVYSFFVIYARIDGFDPAAAIAGEAGQLTGEILATARGCRPAAQRSELDRWILSELSRTAAAAVERMDAYDNFSACGRLSEFVDALSNWYVRRSRDRFWSSEQSPDKLDAYWTLYQCLIATCKLIAPFVPFVAEQMWQNLAAAAFGDRVVESVHLCAYPTGERTAVDELLSRRMALMREIVSLGRSARMGAKLKVRQPLARVEVVLADDTHLLWLQQHAALICDELNVKQVEFIEEADHYITYTVLPELKRLGPRLGKRLPPLKKLLVAADGGALLAELESKGAVTLALPDGPVTLDREDLQIRLQAKEGWAAAQGPSCVVVLSIELTEDLIREGLARELVRAIQDRRKEMNCEFTDRIIVGVAADWAELSAAMKPFADYIRGETLAVELKFGAVSGTDPVEIELVGHRVLLYIKVVSA